jgi:hypothetical protein
MAKGYRIEHVGGYGGTDHFGREVAARCGGTYPTLTAARQALRAAKAAHNHGTSGLGRLDIVRGDGKRFAWE